MNSARPIAHDTVEGASVWERADVRTTARTRGRHRAGDTGPQPVAYGGPAPPEPVVLLDLLVQEIAGPLRAITPTAINLDCAAAAVRLPALPLWRAVRTLILDGVAAAGPSGRVDVRVRPVEGWALLEVEDAGSAPQPRAARPEPNPVSAFLALCGGRLDVEAGSAGGYRVRMLMPRYAG